MAKKTLIISITIVLLLANASNIISASKTDQNKIAEEKTENLPKLKIEEIQEEDGNIIIGITNQGNTTINNLTWDIKITKTPIIYYNTISVLRYQENNTDESLNSKDTKNIIIDNLRVYGRIKIYITAYADNTDKVSKTKFAYIFGDKTMLNSSKVGITSDLIISFFYWTEMAIYFVLLFKFIEELRVTESDFK